MRLIDIITGGGEKALITLRKLKKNGTEIPFETVHERLMTGIRYPRCQLIQQPHFLERMWDEHWMGTRQSEPPSIDFENGENLIVYAAGKIFVRAMRAKIVQVLRVENLGYASGIWVITEAVYMRQDSYQQTSIAPIQMIKTTGWAIREGDTLKHFPEFRVR